MDKGQEQAFPVTVGPEDFELRYGLTKREYFAAMAMQGILASFTDNFGLTEEQLAEHSVKNADALLKELEK